MRGEWLAGAVSRVIPRFSVLALVVRARPESGFLRTRCGLEASLDVIYTIRLERGLAIEEKGPLDGETRSVDSLTERIEAEGGYYSHNGMSSDIDGQVTYCFPWTATDA